MKRILFIISILISVTAYSQTTGFFRYDTVTFQKVGANSEFNLLNSTRTVTGGVLTNLGNGRTRFVLPSGSSSTGQRFGFVAEDTRATAARYFSSANQVFTIDSLGNGSRFISHPTALVDRKISIVNTNGTDSSYVSINGQSGIRTAIMGVNNTVTGTASDLGAYMRFLSGASTTRALQGEIYVATEPGTGRYIGHVYVDTFKTRIATYLGDFSKYSYLNTYRDSISLWHTSAGKFSGMQMGSGWADQWADDRLAWRSTDSTAKIIIEKNLVELYAGENAIELEDPTGITIEPYKNNLFIDSLDNVIDTTTYKPLGWAPTGGRVVRFNSWAQVSGAGGGGSGTVNTGAANKATYYPSAGTTVDDFIGVEYGLTNNTMRLLPQAVGDTALVLRAKASQTAPLLWTQDAAGAGQFKIWENGYISNAIYKAYPVEFHANVGGVFGRFGTQFAFSNAPENSQVGIGIFARADGSENGFYKYDATGGISMYANGIVTPRFYLAAATGNVGIGTGTTVSARLHSLSTTEQLRLGYDASNYLSTTIGSTGGTTFDAIGAGSIFNFSDNVTITNNSLNGNQLYVSSTSTAVNGPASLVRADFSGANAAASVSTYGGFFNNNRTGTTSLTYGVYGQASDGTTNYGVFGQASGGTTAIGGNFTVSGASNNYPIITAGGNSGFNTANPTSTLHTTSFATAYRAITALRTLDITDHTIEVTANTFTVTLPTAVGITGRQYVITNSGAGTTTIATTSSQTFVNVTATPTTLTVNQFSTVTVVSNGSNWLRTSSL